MTAVDFSLRVYTEECLFGPDVRLIRTLFNGDVQEEWMPVAVACHLMACDPDNGLVYARARIDAAGVFLGSWDGSG
jgi:hypothetical protein